MKKLWLLCLVLTACKPEVKNTEFDPSKSTLTLPESTAAGRIDFSAALKDTEGNQLRNTDITVSVTGAGATLGFAPQVSGNDGVVTGQLSVPTAGEVTLTLKSGTRELSGTVTVVAGPPIGPRFFSQPSSVKAGVPIAPPVVLEIVDSYGNRSSGPFAAYVRITRSSHGDSLLNGGSSTNPVAADGGLVVLDNLIVTLPQVGYALRAEAPDTSVADESVQFDVTPGDPFAGLSTLVSAPPNGVADGTPVTLTLTVRDQANNALQGVEAAFSVSGTGNTLTPDHATTDEDGVASVTLSSTVAEVKTVTAMVGDAGVQATVTFIQ